MTIGNLSVTFVSFFFFLFFLWFLFFFLFLHTNKHIHSHRLLKVDELHNKLFLIRQVRRMSGQVNTDQSFQGNTHAVVQRCYSISISFTPSLPVQSNTVRGTVYAHVKGWCPLKGYVIDRDINLTHWKSIIHRTCNPQTSFSLYALNLNLLINKSSLLWS